MNIKVKGVLITVDLNPLGARIQHKVHEEILHFVTLKNIHHVSNETYSGSVSSSLEFISIAKMLEARNYNNAERVHIVYSLSKEL
ncbi:hypothetical protein TanjilG_21758 [Lupinus angustifolius]|uniref:Aminotransferase class I/classII large domain-containing protein n=1 Tax=Lupinus angustifolius TaxID=3871 RepID=A0A1J7GGJ7_LUPAN|nr:hypothetical protein TanjilG_21758 [Lupinus angustifolius]